MTKNELIVKHYQLENEAENFFVLAVIAMVLGTVILALSTRGDSSRSLVLLTYVLGIIAGFSGFLKAVAANNIKEEILKS